MIYLFGLSSPGASLFARRECFRTKNPCFVWLPCCLSAVLFLFFVASSPQFAFLYLNNCTIMFQTTITLSNLICHADTLTEKTSNRQIQQILTAKCFFSNNNFVILRTPRSISTRASWRFVYVSAYTNGTFRRNNHETSISLAQNFPAGVGSLLSIAYSILYINVWNLAKYSKKKKVLDLEKEEEEVGISVNLDHSSSQVQVQTPSLRHSARLIQKEPCRSVSLCSPVSGSQPGIGRQHVPYSYSLPLALESPVKARQIRKNLKIGSEWPNFTERIQKKTPLIRQTPESLCPRPRPSQQTLPPEGI